MCEPCTPDTLLEAVRALQVADPDLGQKPLLAKLREQQPDLGAGAKEVREALTALKAESEAKAQAEAAAATTPPPAADEGGAPSNVALSLACIGCFRLPSDMDDEREKHPICDMCRDEKLPTTYLCGDDCPANPGAWKLHGVFHKKLKKQRKEQEDGGVMQQQNREEAEKAARDAAQTGDKYMELLAKGARYASKEDWRKSAKAFREAIALRPDKSVGYLNLGTMLANSGHKVEAAQRHLEAKERASMGSELWAVATASAFSQLEKKECTEAPKPEWWNDKELKPLSARVVRAAPNQFLAIGMRAVVLSGWCAAWEAGPRSAAEFTEAAAHFERAAALCGAPAGKAELSRLAVLAGIVGHRSSV